MDVLKIDKSFISGLQSQDSQSGDAVIVRAIISLATSLNLTVVAEGIETLEQLHYLKANHCQGGAGVLLLKAHARVRSSDLPGSPPLTPEAWIGMVARPPAAPMISPP